MLVGREYQSKEMMIAQRMSDHHFDRQLNVPWHLMRTVYP